MIEDAQGILDCLPKYYANEEEQDYVPFLWDAFICNYQHDKYQFAFLAYHMLFMVFVYFSIWKVQSINGAEFDMALIGSIDRHEKDLLKTVSPFGFWVVGEAQFLKFLRLVGLKDQIKKYKDNVKIRNDSTHANGRIILNSKDRLDTKIQDILDYIAEIQLNMKNVLFGIYGKLLKEEDDGFDHFQEALLRQNYFSQQDMKMCLEFGFDSLAVRGRKRLIGQIKKQYIEAYGAGNE